MSTTLAPLFATEPQLTETANPMTTPAAAERAAAQLAPHLFAQAAANPTYTDKAKTLMALGVCQVSAGQTSEAEQSLMHSYELDAGNPVTGYNLSKLLYARGDLTRAQFYIRRLNNSELANAQTLWLGVKTERKLNNQEAAVQLAGQLRKRFSQSPEAAAYEKGAFNE